MIDYTTPREIVGRWYATMDRDTCKWCRRVHGLNVWSGDPLPGEPGMTCTNPDGCRCVVRGTINTEGETRHVQDAT